VPEGKPGLAGTFLCTSVSKSSGNAKQPLPELSSMCSLSKLHVYHTDLCFGKVSLWIYTCVCHLLATKYWVIVSKLFYNKFIDDLSIQDRWAT
jgi:hypothetical protein